MRYCLFLFIIFSLSNIINAQQNYYLTDTSGAFGVEIIESSDKKNSRYVSLKTYNGLKTLYPEDITEYGFKNGRVYVSRIARINDSDQHVFLERLTDGDLKLYYYKGEKNSIFFVEKDSIFRKLPPASQNNEEKHQEVLREFLRECPDNREYLDFVSYRKGPLKEFVHRNNECLPGPFPRFRYGISIGLNSNIFLIPTDIYSEFKGLDFSYYSSVTMGIFIDKPLLMSNFSLHTEAHFLKNSFSVRKSYPNRDIDFLVETQSLQFPILVRYAYPSNKIRPHLNAGFMIDYKLKNENVLLETSIQNIAVVVQQVTSDYYITNLQYGFSLGGGIEFMFNKKTSLFFDLRYNLLSGSSNYVSLGKQEICLITAINF